MSLESLTHKPISDVCTASFSDIAGALTAQTTAGMKAISLGGASPKVRTAPFIIGIAGGTASGKTTVCDLVAQRLHDSCVVLLSQDSFYKDLGPEDLKLAKDKAYNFDHPDAFDSEGMMRAIIQLKAGKAVDVPIYDFTKHQRATEVRRVEPADVVIIEGILVLCMEHVRDLLDMKVFVDTDDDVRLARRIQRDVAVSLSNTLDLHADLIVPWQQASNIVAIDLITQHIRSKLQQPDLTRQYSNLEIIPSNFQAKGLLTIIRDQKTSKNDFVFYSNRINRLIVEYALGHLPFSEKVVTTPTGNEYVGVSFINRQICGVSIVRSGESMETALRECCLGIKIGKILVHRHEDSKDIIFEKLPADISERHVMLLDPIVSTGNCNCAVKPIQILLDKGVAEDKILFLTMIAAPDGIHAVCSKFPGVKLITCEIDDHIDENYLTVPGVGNYGDRYFSE
eukprot:gene7038-131_t